MGSNDKATFGRKSWAFLWVAWWTVFGTLDWWRDHIRDHTTFSELLRWAFHVDEWWGKALFLFVLSALATIFAIHIAWKKW